MQREPRIRLPMDTTWTLDKSDVFSPNSVYISIGGAVDRVDPRFCTMYISLQRWKPYLGLHANEPTFGVLCGSKLCCYGRRWFRLSVFCFKTASLISGRGDSELDLTRLQ